MANLKNLIVQGASRFIGDTIGKRFITNGGTSNEFVKGDGSLDYNEYLTSDDISGKEDVSNKVTSLTSGSTDTQYPSAKCVYNAIQAAGGGGGGVTSYEGLSDKPALCTTATTTLETAATETISGTINLHKVSKTGSYNDLLNKPTIPSAPGTLSTTATTAQATASTEALSGTIKLHKVAKTGTYSDLIGTPTIPSAPGTLSTSATTAQATASTEALSSAINLHKIAKTGTYSDLIGKPTTGTSAQFLKGDGSLDSNTYLTSSSISGKEDTSNKVTNISSGSTNTQYPSAKCVFDAINLVSGSVITSYDLLSNRPRINTTNTTAQITSGDETLTGLVNLHKVAKTGTYSDLIGTPTIPSAPGTLSTTATTAQATATSESLSGTIKLHKVAKTGTYTDLLGKPTLGSASEKDVGDFASSAHTHGYITSGGTITADTTVASGMKLVTTNGSGYVVRSSVVFGSDTTKALTNAGTWASFASSQHSHGYITASGTIDISFAETPSNGTRLLILGDQDTITCSDIVFKSSGTTKALTEAGTWSSFSKPPLFIDVSSNNPSSVAAGSYNSALTAISEGRQVIVRYNDEYSKYFVLAMDYSDIEQYLEFQNLDLNENPQAMTIQISSGDMVIISTSNIGSTDVSNKENRLTLITTTATALTAQTNTYYRFTSNVNTLSIRLPAPETTYASKIMFSFTTGSSPNITFTRANTSYHIYAQDGYSIEASKKYELYALCDGANWVITSVKIGTTYIV